jgi:hypothetical protein
MAKTLTRLQYEKIVEGLDEKLGLGLLAGTTITVMRRLFLPISGVTPSNDDENDRKI